MDKLQTLGVDKKQDGDRPAEAGKNSKNIKKSKSGTGAPHLLDKRDGSCPHQKME